MTLNYQIFKEKNQIKGLFFEGKILPKESTWNKNLHRWTTEESLNPEVVSIKITRKTIESWSTAVGLLELSYNF